MKVCIEDFTAYHASAWWRLHDAWFEARGLAAWHRGELPYRATTNMGLALQHARFLVGHVEALLAAGRAAPGDPVVLLEVGAGSGVFAANLLRALAEGCGPEGRLLVGRVQLVVTDVCAKTIQEACASQPLVGWVQSGHVRPGVLDIRYPAKLTTPDGAPLDVRVDLVIANGVASISRTAYLRYHKRRWQELQVALDAELPEGLQGEAALEAWLAEPTTPNRLRDVQMRVEWKAARLEGLSDSYFHADVVRWLFDGNDKACFPYCYGFFDFIEGARRYLKMGALFILNDQGPTDPAAVERTEPALPKVYGNSGSHPVHVRAFDGFAKAIGGACLRSPAEVRSNHTVVLSLDPRFREGTEAAFKASFVDVSWGEDVNDFASAARLSASQRAWRRAAHLYRRCVAIAPFDPEWQFRYGEALLEAGMTREARSVFETASAMKGIEPWDVPFQLGRLAVVEQRWAEAVALYTRSLALDESPVTHTNLAYASTRVGDLEGAKAHYAKALALDPGNIRAAQQLTALENAVAGMADSGLLPG